MTIPNKPGRAPNIGVIFLIPVDKGLLQGDTRDSRPASTETNIVLAIEEVGRIARIKVHGLESIMWRQRCASPFPKTPEIALSAQPVAVACYGCRMPVAKRDIAIVELDKELVRIKLGSRGTAVNGAVRQMV